MISAATKLTAVIGDPVTHSLSPIIHNAIYKNENVDAVLLAFGNPSIADLVTAIRTLPIHMAAVTMPHKQSIMPLLDSVDEDAKEIGAVNTVINEGGTLKGFNTDVVGFAECFKDVALKGKKVLVIGAGGVARPIAYHLRRSGAEVYCMSRTLAEAQALCATFGGTAIEASQLKDFSFDVIVNATPIGMTPKIDATPVPKEFIKSDAVVFDVVYAPLETKLLREGKEQGARVISGLHMFVAQAIAQERLWLKKDIADQEYTTLIETHLQNK